MSDHQAKIKEMTEAYASDLQIMAEKAKMDPIVVACIGLSDLTLDLVWALEWLNTLKDKRTNEDIVDEFMQELKERCEDSNTLKISAREANLL